MWGPTRRGPTSASPYPAFPAIRRPDPGLVIVDSPSMFQWVSASRSDVGLVRLRNEDAILDQPERGLWAVADGMGGHAIGDYASQTVVATLASLPVPASLESYVGAARHKLEQVNRLLLDEAARRHVRRIGTTIALLL